MKRQIRRGVFETNSSSVHSLTICSKEEYDSWYRGKVLYDKWNQCFVTYEDALEDLKEDYEDDNTINWEDEDQIKELLNDNGIKTMEEFFDGIDFETFEEEYTTPLGEKIVAFGYFGYDG